MVVPSDYTVVGTVLALAVAILLLSGLVLYVAFRVRETLRDEKGGSTKAVKVAFLIGLLFLSGGVFYFFASGFNASGGSSTIQTTSSTGPTSSTTSSTLTSGSSTATTTSTTTATSTTTTTPTTTTTTAVSQTVSMQSPSCAGTRVTAGSTFSCYVYIYDQGSTSYAGATLISSGDFAKFTFLSCIESTNGGPPAQVSCSGNTVAVGSVVPNSLVLTLTIQAPTQSGQYSNSVLTLSANGLSPISVTFSIQVTA